MLNQLGQFHDSKLDQFVLTHRIRRNLAVGARPEYKIHDLINTYDSVKQIKSMESWVIENHKDLTLMLIKMKVRAINDICRKGQLSDDIDEKRLCLIDAIRMENELMELING